MLYSFQYLLQEIKRRQELQNLKTCVRCVMQNGQNVNSSDGRWGSMVGFGK